jgi:hypothetical protein
MKKQPELVGNRNCRRVLNRDDLDGDLKVSHGQKTARVSGDL